MKNTTYIKDIELNNDEVLEIHRCPECTGIFGIDYTFVDQVQEEVVCMMCLIEIHISDTEDK